LAGDGHVSTHPQMTTLRYQAKTLSPLRSDDYSIVIRNGVSLHLTRAHDQSVLDRSRGHISIYLEVENIESLWAHVSQFKNRYKIRDLFDRDYGMREFHIVDSDDCLIFVGQKIEPR
jgi:hypothetical protein